MDQIREYLGLGRHLPIPSSANKKNPTASVDQGMKTESLMPLESLIKVRSDLPGYLADSEADGVCVSVWNTGLFIV